MKTKNKNHQKENGVLTKLIPWFISIGVYFSVYTDTSPEDGIYVAVKLLPMLSLLLFMHLIDGLSHRYSRLLFIGLAFSTVGDALLVFPKDYFLPGMASFGIAHCLYVTAFGFKRLRLSLGLVLLASAIVFTYPNFNIIPDPVLKYGISVYSLLLFTMGWRALDRFRNFSKVSIAANHSEICGALGAVLFGISDNILAHQLFVGAFKYSKFLIMATYYGAQLFIALSAVEVLRKQRQRQKDE